jgi:hypothetical protein
VEAEKVSNRSSGLGWGSALRILLGAVLVAILARGAILLSITIFAHSNHWDLPSGAVLERVLASCQVMHVRRAGVDSEQMLCPMRHAPDNFPEVLRNAVVASEDRRFFSHRAVDLRSTLRAVWLHRPNLSRFTPRGRFHFERKLASRADGANIVRCSCELPYQSSPCSSVQLR